MSTLAAFLGSLVVFSVLVIHIPWLILYGPRRYILMLRLRMIRSGDIKGLARLIKRCKGNPKDILWLTEMAAKEGKLPVSLSAPPKPHA